MKRILSLDGGGIRGVFTLELLLRMQTLLREHSGNPHLVLSDHFDLFAGTSTGAIIATSLCWGMDVEEIMAMYMEFGSAMFSRVPWYRPVKRLLISRYQAQPLSEILQRRFSEDGEGKIPALLESDRLRKLLLVVVRNHSTGSSWPVTNNPRALFNQPEAPDSNLKIPIWKLVRASTAAPVYFDPERITVGGREQRFVDGSITPYNNPALIAALTATLPCYHVNWPTGTELLRVVSLGTLRFSSAVPEAIKKLWLTYNASKIPPALIQSIAWEQDFILRCMGECIYGEPLDMEIGDMVGGAHTRQPWFSYVRYNKSYNSVEAQEALRKHPHLSQLDAIDSITALRDIGREYAEQHIRIEHLV